MRADPPPEITPRPVAVEPRAPPASAQTMLLVGVVVVAALALGREVLVPFALALLLSFALAPLVTRLDRLGLGRIPSVLITVLVLFAVLGGLVLVVAGQLRELATNMPYYEYNLRNKIQRVQQAGGEEGVISRTLESFRQIRREIEKATAAEEGEPAPWEVQVEERPQPVVIRGVETSPLDTALGYIAPVLQPVATFGIVLVFVVFMLIAKEDLRDRLIRLVGARDLSRTTAALDDAGRRVSRYLLAQLTVNLCYGIPVGIGLWLIGLPNPLLWGLLGTLLRFIPYLGPVLGALLPITLALAVEPGFQTALLTIGFFILLELVLNNVVEPVLYGASTGLSAVAIIVAAVFWTTLWGPIGLLLATPLTVCLVVMGRHVPQLEFLDVMFGATPALPLEARIYQRLLADDVYEAGELVEDEAEKRGLAAALEEILLPVLSLALQDRQREAITLDRAERIARGVAAIAAEAAELDAAAELKRRAGARREAPAPVSEAAAPPVLCIGARHGVDAAAAELLAILLTRAGRPATTAGAEAIAPRRLQSLDADGVHAVALCYVAPTTLQHAERTVRRFRLKLGEERPIVVAVLHAAPDVAKGARDLITSASEVALSLPTTAAALGADARDG